MSRRLFSWLFALMFFLITACGGDGGISSPADYMKAVNSFKVSKVTMLQKASEAKESGDPRLLSGAVEQLLPALHRMHKAAHNVKVDDPILTPVHNLLLAAVDSYRQVIDTLAPGISNTPLGISKAAMKAALEAFKLSVKAWESAMSTLSQ